MKFSVVYSYRGSSSTVSRTIWDFEVLFFCGRRKPEKPKINPRSRARLVRREFSYYCSIPGSPTFTISNNQGPLKIAPKRGISR